MWSRREISCYFFNKEITLLSTLRVTGICVARTANTDLNNVIFKQEGATGHTARNTIQQVNEGFQTQRTRNNITNLPRNIFER